MVKSLWISTILFLKIKLEAVAKALASTLRV
jgi:hypothetical protein